MKTKESFKSKLSPSLYLYFIYLIIIILCVGIGIYNSITYDYECLNEIANNYCKSIDYNSGRTSFILMPSFDCYFNRSDIVQKHLLFTTDEVKECKK